MKSDHKKYLIIGAAGLLAYMLFFKKNDQPGFTDTTGGDFDYSGEPDQVYQGTPVVYSIPTNNTYVNYLKGKLPDSIVSKIAARALPTIATLYSIYGSYFDASWPHWDVLVSMTDAEINYVWWYLGNYVKYGKTLTSSNNIELYNAMQAIHNKYGIF